MIVVAKYFLRLTENILTSDTKMAIFAHSAMPPQLKILKLALPKIFGDTLLQL